MKYFRKPCFAIIFASLILFVSCSQYDSVVDNKKSFDYSTYNKGISIINEIKPNFSLKINSIVGKTTSRKQFVLDEINLSIATSPTLNMSALDYFDNTGEEIANIGINDGFFNETDIILLEKFSHDWVQNDIEMALVNFENNVKDLNLSDIEFDKYNYFANVMKLGDFNFNNETARAEEGGLSWRCAWAIAQFTASTIAVGMACVPNPTSPLACPLAITLSASAYANMLVTCNKQ